MRGRLAAWLVGAAAIWFAGLAALHALILTPMAGGLQSPDHPAAFGFDHFQAWLAALDDSERRTFLAAHTLSGDLVFPCLLGAALFLLLRAILLRFERFASLSVPVRNAVVAVLVLPGVAFDLLENALTAGFLTGRISLTPQSAGMLDAVTILKYASLAVAALLIAAFALAALRNRPATRP